MPLIGRRRPLLRAAMVGGAGYVAGKRMSQSQQQEPQPAAPTPPPPTAAPSAAPVASEADRVEALTKLKDLRDSEVLTQEQYEAERQKLLQGL
jgi:putative oligomerization/nucleic acid binding protein